MDTTALDPSHALSGHNPTLFDVVVQYADMDMLRALVLTSQSMYKTLQHCRFDHLTMAVLEAPILAVQQQVVYNGADPVSTDTFRITVNDAAATPLAETKSSIPPLTRASFQTQHRGLIFPDSHAFDAWKRRSVVHNDLNYNLIIPDYARNFMARAQSVELVVYRPRLGTYISTFFTDNAHRFKHGPPTAIGGCASCVESECHNESTSSTLKHKLHLPCLTAPPHALHRDEDGEHMPKYSTHLTSDNVCTFSKYPSHRYPNGDATEPRRLSHTFFQRTAPVRRKFPFDDLPSFKFKILHNIIRVRGVLNDILVYSVLAFLCFAYGLLIAMLALDPMTLGPLIPFVRRLCKRIITIETDTPLDMNFANTTVFHPRFQNLPLVAQQALTTSLNIRVADCVSFGVADWCNATPGCTVQPIQTCNIRYRVPIAVGESKGDINIADHFPRLTSLVLNYTRLDETNRCGINGFNVANYTSLGLETSLSHFFIGNYVSSVTHLPHLQHFGVIGTLLEPEEYALIAIRNARVTSLIINPGLQPIDDAYLLAWVKDLNWTLDDLECFGSSSDDEQEGDEDDGEDFVQRETARLSRHDESTQPMETTELTHRLTSRRKYNFSIDIADPCLDNCCPHKTHILNQRALAEMWVNSDDETCQDLTQVGQHAGSCGSIYGILSTLYSIDASGCDNNYTLPVSSSLTLSLPFAATVPRVALAPIVAVAGLAQRTFKYLNLHCHYCSHQNRRSAIVSYDASGVCTSAGPPSSANVPPAIDGLPQDDTDTHLLARVARYDEQMYMRLRELLRIPKHVVLRL